MTRTVFIADTHLSESTPHLNELFLDVLNTQVTGANQLYLLGDIFEHWIGDDYQPPWLTPITESLKVLNEGGTSIFFAVGNRDFLVSSTYLNQFGATLLEENTLIQCGSTPTVICHGDALCTDDTAYQQFRAMVRDRAWQEMILSQPIEARLALASQLRSTSKEQGAQKSQEIMDVNPNAVEALLNELSARCLIHGHTHRPAVHNLDQGRQRIVLGDWRENEPSTLIIDDNEWILSAHGHTQQTTAPIH